MTYSIVILLVVVGAYLAAQLAFGRIAERFRIVSGAEYLLLGFLLGPQVSGLLTVDVLHGFAPFLSLALGWIGAIVGAQFYLPQLVRISSGHYRIALLEALITFFTVGGSMTWILSWALAIPVQAALIPGIVLGAIATAAAPTGIAMVAQGLSRPGALVRQLEITAAIDSLIAVTGLGVLVAITHPGVENLPRSPTPTEWVVITLGLGIIGGILFHLFLGDETRIDRIFIGLVGSVLLVSGAAEYLGLSSLLPAMLVGAILIHTADNREETLRVLQTVERPIYFVLLIFAGAAWVPIVWMGIIPVIAFLLLRRLAKTGGAALSARLNGALSALGAGWGRALMGQGGLGLAIALSFQIHDPSMAANVVFTAAIASVLLTDLTAARVAAAVVRDAPASGQPPAQAGDDSSKDSEASADESDRGEEESA